MALEICRICGGSEALKHVFIEGSIELLDQIRLCANIEIDEHDCLPKFVCNVCEQGLAFAYNLRKRGEETEKKLRQELLANSKNEPYSQDDESEGEFVDVGLIEETCDEQLWVKDDNSPEFDEYEDSILNVDDGAICIPEDIPEEIYSETQQCIEIEEHFYNDTTEIIEEVKADESVVDFMEVFYEENEGTNELDQTEIQIVPNKKPKKVEFQCNTCEKVFDVRSKYCDHVKEHGDKRFHCIVCDKWFSARYRYDEHMKNHSSKEGAFPCPKCCKSYTIQCNLERHIRSAHNGEKRFQCSECGSSFGRADILKMHMAKHSTERPIECDICQKKFKTTHHLHYHKISHLQKSEKPVRLKSGPKNKNKIYMCNFCDKVSDHRTTHLNHLRTHTGEKPYKCSVCDKAFRTSHAKTNHMLLHTDERPHKCKVCGMSFRQNSHVKSHMLTHTGVKRHVCDFCQKAFAMKSNLVVHLRMHTGTTTYACNKCPQKFSHLSQVKRHKMSHMSEDELRNESCDGNETKSEYYDAQYIDDIIEIKPEGSDSIVMSDCVVEEC